jgi:CRP/FNR family cyclic AMP-dependent transcriptional regulator
MNQAVAHTPGEECELCTARVRCPFGRLKDKIVRQFDAIARLKVYDYGIRIFRQGESSAGIFVVCTGWVELVHLTPLGKSVAHDRGPGSVLGLTEVLTGTSYQASAHASKHSRLECVSKPDFQHFLSTNPESAIELLREACSETQRISTELYDVVGKVPSAERLLRTLQELSETYGHTTAEGVQLTLPLTGQDLADRIGCSRQWISGLLSDLEIHGLIRRKKGWITLAPTGTT